MSEATGQPPGPGVVLVRATLLGRFSLTKGDKTAGPWERPSARRLCQLLLISPGHGLDREAVCEALFPNLGPAAAVHAVHKALSMGRTALVPLGLEAAALLKAERGRVSFGTGTEVEVDFEAHQQALSAGMAMAPGRQRDELLVEALRAPGTLLEHEPYAEWATGPREALETLRQEARLCLARDRAKGYGPAGRSAVIEAWEACFAHDATCEEAAAALARAYAEQGRHRQVAATYERCRDALDELGLRPSQALEALYAAHTAKPRSARRADLGRHQQELRLVSVLFVEVAAPTIGPRPGPEDLRDLVDGALSEAIAHVDALGGTVMSVFGSGLVALFGAPQAHEDDPERALLAGFRIVTDSRSVGNVLSLRAGVETGQAVVGPLVETSPTAHYGAVGDVVRTAAALHWLARSASVLVGPVTRQATETLFEWGPTEQVIVAAGSKPVPATYLGRPKARPLGSSGSRRLFVGSGPLFGRGAELSLLHQALQDAISSGGSVVTVTGEAGLGKTRLVNECHRMFMAWANADPKRLPLWLEGRAASYASSSPYALYRQLLAALVGVAAEDDEDVVRHALERALKAVLGAGTSLREQVGLLAHMIAPPSRRVTTGGAAPSPEMLQRATFGAVKSLVAGLASRGPTVVVLEDLHWADPTSLKLTRELCPMSRGAPLLVIITSRSEPGLDGANLGGPAPGEFALRTLELCPLARSVEHQLARALIGTNVPDAVISSVSRGAGGNPLFLEEQISLLLGTGALARAGGTWQLRDGAPTDVPQALERLVQARIDRLDHEVRHVLLCASVLGAEFGPPALSALVDAGTDIDRALDGMCAEGLVLEVSGASVPTYRFRHELVCDAIYGGLVRDERRRLHARAAWALEEAAPNGLEDVAAVLGHHYAMAGENERAAHFLGVAADHAATEFANEEALACCRRALELIGHRAGERAAPGASLWDKLGHIYWRLGRYEEAQHAFAEAVAAAPSEDFLLAARCSASLGALGAVTYSSAEASTALDRAEELLSRAPNKEAADWVEIWLYVHWARVEIAYWRDPPQAEELLARAKPVVEDRGTSSQRARFYDQAGHLALRARRYQADDSVLAYFRAAKAAVGTGEGPEQYWADYSLGSALLHHGDTDAALVHLSNSLRGAEQTGETMLRLLSLSYVACALRIQGNLAATRDTAMALEELGSALARSDSVGLAKAMMSWVAWKEGRPADVETLAHEALENWEKASVRLYGDWTCLWPLIAVLTGASRYEEAVGAARQLFAPHQMRLPATLEATVESAIKTWDDGHHSLVGERLAGALLLAQQLNFL